MIERLAEATIRPLSSVRYAYYAFIFSIPIETLDIGMEKGVFSLSKLTGILFIAMALLQPQLCFKKPPKPFWYFLAYILVFLCLATLQESQFIGLIIVQLITLGMMLTLFWVSYNLLQDKSMVKGAFLSMIGSCAVLAGLVFMGFGEAVAQGRTTAMSQNANMLGATLSLGMLALLGLTYGRNDDLDGRIRLLLWICVGGIAAGIVATGSRGVMVGLLVGIFLLVVRRGDFVRKVQVGFIAFVAIAGLVWTSYENEAMRIRWERTLQQGDTSGRDKIQPEAWNMFMEKPLFGWGPVNHYVELGNRLGLPSRDPHNLYLWIMNETGLLGSVPFFIGLLICCRAGWRATYGTEGSLPIALLTCQLILNMSGTFHLRKLFWVVLAYSLASESFLSTRMRVTYPADSIEKSPHPVGYRLHQM